MKSHNRLFIRFLGVGLVGAWSGAYCGSRKRVLLDGQNRRSLSLLGVLIITRHGLRTPLSTYPNDRAVWACPHKLLSMLAMNPEEDEHVTISNFYDDTKYAHQIATSSLYLLDYERDRQNLKGNCRSGQLTEIGAKQMSELGQKLRHRYIDSLAQPLLQDTFNRQHIYLRSTHFDRTIESLQSIIYGVYPPGKRQPGEVIKINLREDRTENMYPRTTCARYAQLGKAKLESSEWKSHEDQNAEMRAQLQKILGRNFSTWTGLNSTFTSTIAHNLPLPLGISQRHLDHIENEADYFFGRIYAGAESARLGIGRFLGDIIQKIEEMEERRQDGVRFAIFSGHDSTLGPLLSAYNVNDGKHPPMAAFVTFELLQESDGEAGGKLWVRMLYNDTDLALEGSKEQTVWFANANRYEKMRLLSLEEFKAMTQIMIPNDYEMECKAV
eukprot:TRINITY_DN306_c0_g1_i1.p1 TRINITY_DN306_c0_g1~~TRINITY_DN306_c0_g1_i1.p1  ORF type:complete len:440 (-),score=43.33 TRINITY_DN306_c0_g1_i1:23-1342(-)